MPDDGAGVVKIPFPLTGAAFARWPWRSRVSPTSTCTCSIRTGKIVASSTNGGTDEQIDLELPADGNYTLVVHGWQVPPADDPMTFGISTWVVPLASGGSLKVDSAPASAVIGTTGTVQVSWSGLAPGWALPGRRVAQRRRRPARPDADLRRLVSSTAD